MSEQILAIKASLSAARLSTYEAAANTRGDDDSSALDLYLWNAQVSGGFLAPLHICEVVVRNAVADAIEAKYGSRWPWSPGFEQSLPSPSVAYSPRQDLFNARRNAHTVGKVIPELKFVFWQRMFTSRHDARVWDPHLLRVLPGLDPSKSVSDLRKAIYDDLEEIRTLRNRIAHHEPIFTRSLKDDFQRIMNLIDYRSRLTANWVRANHQVHVLDMLQRKPAPTP
ncbi:hypothetical protein [Rhodospirillum rubrum]|uniref:Abi-like protein n=1 Tax=Rhodospirillum rubrum (strain ATCC 11170 / ATH 1.1.1 / DSM 467 / LMG 4362 / NCIMB 8255 / S1) TaxID=269796 RepID=Q2RWU4_RHORT|nr:hypothetical protein [Rhodospirillum rubrum]ABC21401.1 Protein of unknown function DUF1526 [Rhodospirillum rubrum ATCC 11170]AEO47081.1 hypothetical protein F11_03055 [Rhodospirillum rubrum F11]MBK5952994.1 hypothetical protein [Rhodospirillum rubrum]QXG81079.1 hypothetical protein KUL73_03100 [Rhodospirillum rubrum]HAP98622.1 hypothetical protein [Rhodospirillum rubrum]